MKKVTLDPTAHRNLSISTKNILELCFNYFSITTKHFKFYNHYFK